MPSEHIVRPLFGGAIKAVTPPDLIDASSLRQIPDNQEVFMYEDCGVSIIIEVLQRVPPTDFKDAIKYHFESLADDNSAISSQFSDVNIVANDRGDNTPSVVILRGTQQVSKFNQTTNDEVRVLMALYRVEDKDIDLVVTFNVPLQSADGGAVTDAQDRKAGEDFDRFSRSLRIEDFSLFA